MSPSRCPCSAGVGGVRVWAARNAYSPHSPHSHPLPSAQSSQQYHFPSRVTIVSLAPSLPHDAQVTCLAVCSFVFSATVEFLSQKGTGDGRRFRLSHGTSVRTGMAVELTAARHHQVFGRTHAAAGAGDALRHARLLHLLIHANNSFFWRRCGALVRVCCGFAI